MRDLQHSDRVATVTSSPLSVSASPVLAFSHRDAIAGGVGNVDLVDIRVVGVFDEMVPRSNMTLNDGGPDEVLQLSLTPNHLIPIVIDHVGDGAGAGRSYVSVPARDVVAGMRTLIVAGHGNAVRVGRVESVAATQAAGVRLFAPHTVRNNIVVDGVVVSCATEGMFFSSPSFPSEAISSDPLLTALLAPAHILLLIVDRESLEGIISILLGATPIALAAGLAFASRR